MNYLVTGATGFIGRFLVARLLQREGSRVFALIRPGSEYKLEAMARRLQVGPERLVAISGDMTQPLLGMSKRDQEDLRGQLPHLFHLAAIYDLAAAESQQYLTNVEGTRQALALANELQVGCFHHVSSIAAAGLYDGTFYEDMFVEAGELANPYLQTKHESEALVRAQQQVAFRIYRPAMVVGDSHSGEMDKVDGPYYFFKLIQKLGDAIPPWIPLIGVDGGRFNIVPVDYVAAALDALAHQPGHEGECFHLTAPHDYSLSEVINIFAAVADAPKMPVNIDLTGINSVPKPVRHGVAQLPPTKFVLHQALESLDIPENALRFLTYPTQFDSSRTQRLLADSDIQVPELESYAQTLWDYWANHLDPDRNERIAALEPAVRLSHRVDGKIVVVTGATSGIGKAAALKLARAGAILILVARDKTKLEQTLHEIESLGGQAFTYSCDVSNLAAVDALVAQLLSEHRRVDILINNAGRSIRRSITHSFDRFHDFERTMQLNYFGALRLTMDLLPSMIAQESGHVINISSIGVLTSAPRFSAYVASKAALDAFTRCAGSELSHLGVRFTTINMPLVRTPMIAPTKIYNHVPTISPAQAADMICDAIVRRPKRIATSLGIFGQIMHFLTPRTTQLIMNSGYKMFSDSAAALSSKDAPGNGAEAESPAGPGAITRSGQQHSKTKFNLTREQALFSRLFKGIHW